MAKASKKTEKTDKQQASSASKPAAASKSKKTAAATKPASPAAAAAPLIDTSLAAANAAKLLAAGVNLKASPSGGSAARPESSMFKQLKSGLNKPHASAMNNLLDKTHGPAAHKSGQPFGAAGKQVGQNQTFGADVTRTGVPRRTSG